MFIIEDEAHAEPQGEFPTFDAAVAELRRRAAIAWNKPPNLAPCTSWQTCGRKYEIIEYDASGMPLNELSRVPALEISAREVTWLLPGS
jgi:hypothetical protein